MGRLCRAFAPLRQCHNREFPGEPEAPNHAIDSSFTRGFHHVNHMRGFTGAGLHRKVLALTAFFAILMVGMNALSAQAPSCTREDHIRDREDPGRNAGGGPLLGARRALNRITIVAVAPAPRIRATIAEIEGARDATGLE